MSWVDIVIIALVVMFGGFGVWKGVQKSALALGAFLISFIIAFFLANVVSEGLLNVEAVRRFVFGDDVNGATGFSLYGWVLNSMSDTVPTEFLTKNFIEPILKVVTGYRGYTDTFTVQNGYALYLAFNMFSVIVGLALFLVIRGLLSIVTMIVKSFIPRKKSAGNRVGGLFVGFARGGIWALVLSVVVSVIGGFTFASGFNAIEKEFEESVIGKYVYQGAYGIKNGAFIPGDDMYARLVDKSGFAVKGGEEEEPDPLAGKKDELYIELYNLNYSSGDAYEKNEAGEIVFDESAIKFDGNAYVETGFDAAVKAITDYNAALAESIKSGSLDSIDATALDGYLTIRTDIYGEIYGGEDNLFGHLHNYMNAISEAKTTSSDASQEIVDIRNAALSEHYDAIVRHLNELKTLYAGFTLMTESETVGSLEIPTYPEKLTVEELIAAPAE